MVHPITTDRAQDNTATGLASADHLEMSDHERGKEAEAASSCAIISTVNAFCLLHSHRNN